MSQLKDQLDNLLEDMKDQIKSLAIKEYADFQSAAIHDGTAFLTSAEGDILLWTSQVATKKLTKDELNYLIKGKMDVTELHTLTQAGLAKVRVQQFREGVIEILLGGILKASRKLI